ncbi:hypothetical protein, partial [Caulobacter sp.]
TEAAATWTARALRPLAPAHVRTRWIGDDFRVTWIRRARLGGDVWDGEVPSEAGADRFRVRVLDGEAVLMDVEMTGPAFVYAAAARAAHAPSPAARVEIRQGSALYGWGSAATTGLW